MDHLPTVLLVFAALAALAYWLVPRKKSPQQEVPDKLAAKPVRPAELDPPLDPANSPQEIFASPTTSVPATQTASSESAPTAQERRARRPATRERAPTKTKARAAQPAEGYGATKVSDVRPAASETNGLRKGLAATRGGFVARLRLLITGKREVDASILEPIEEVLITSDVGVRTTQVILNRLRTNIEQGALPDAAAVWAALRSEATRIMSVGGAPVPPKGKPCVILMVGVNGVGKTTTIGKLATKWSHEGKSVLLAAGDTFRAAAVEQLEVWAKRVGVEVVRGKEGADPGAVAYEATKTASSKGVDILLVDTAGRLHTKVNLMEEIKKVKRSIGKALEGAPHETLLVVDATTGQNALSQAAMFKDALDLTGIVLTKLDGTAKGGVVLAVAEELQVPVRYVGLGESAEDLRLFDATEFAEALFGSEEGDNAPT